MFRLEGRITYPLTQMRRDPPAPPVFLTKLAVGQIEEEIRDLYPLKMCLNHPLEGGSPGAYALKLRIVDQIKVHDDINSQIVKVEPVFHGKDHSPLSPVARSSEMALKLNDPLYTNFEGTNKRSCRELIFWIHTQDNGISLLGTAARDDSSSFYSSYPVDLPRPDGSTKSRPVRAIVCEYIRGILLAHINPQNYSHKQRQAIMTAILDADSRIWQCDVTFRPRPKEYNSCLCERKGKCRNP
jgi:hypothetical protein